MTVRPRLTTSVVVVTKDRPQMIRSLLRSLTTQSLMPDEVILVDNNSSLSYETVIEEFRSVLPLRVVVEMTHGIPAARNRGIHEATGDIVLFTDDDCQADPSWIENIAKPFYLNPHIGTVGGEILSVPRSGSLVEEFCIAETLMRMGREPEPSR